MPVVEIPKEKWTGQVHQVKLGGSGRKEVVVGGENTLPFLHFEGSIPNPPKVAIEVWDNPPEEWAPSLLKAWGDVTKDPVQWAKKAVEYGADLIYLKLVSAHPETKNTGAAEAAKTVTRVLEAVDVPLLVIGPEVIEKDNEVLVAAAETARGQRIGIGIATDKNYRTPVAACLANNHVIVVNTPMDMNLAKQLNILCCDVGLPPDSILMDTTTGALGYGLEYAVSVMERLRLAGLAGDKMAAMPIINTPGYEAWRQKEAKFAQGVPATWGEQGLRALLWEGITALTLIHAGSDVVVMRHPKAVEVVKEAIAQLMQQ